MSYIPEKINSNPVFFNGCFAVATLLSIILLVLTALNKDWNLFFMALSAGLGSFAGITLDAKEFNIKTVPFLLATIVLIGRVAHSFLL